MEQTTGDLSGGTQVTVPVSDGGEMAKAFFVPGSDTSSKQQETASVEAPTTQESVPSQKEETKSEETPIETRDEEKRSLERKARQAHEMVIDLIDEKFKQLENGRIDDSELRQWFDEHPEFNEVANRSKRVKDSYRSLMTRDPANRTDPDVKSKRDAQIADRGEVDDADKSKKLAEGKPLTITDLEKFFEEREARTAEKGLKTERMSEAEEFAQRLGIVDKNFDLLVKNAEALFKVNENLSWEQALQSANRALFDSGKGPVNLASSNSTAPEPVKPVEKTDFSQGWKPMMSFEQLTGKKTSK